MKFQRLPRPVGQGYKLVEYISVAQPWPWHALAAHALVVACLGSHGIALTAHALAVACLDSHGIALATHALALAAHALAAACLGSHGIALAAHALAVACLGQDTHIRVYEGFIV